MKRLCLARNKSPWVRRFFPPVQDRITTAIVAAVNQTTNEPEPQTPPAEGMRSSEIAGVDFKRMTEEQAERYIEHNITNEAKAELQRRVPGADPKVIPFLIQVQRDALNLEARVTAREQAPILEKNINSIVADAIQDLPYLRDLMFMYVQVMEVIRDEGLPIVPDMELLRKETIEVYEAAHGDEEQIQKAAWKIVDTVLNQAIYEMAIKRMHETNVSKGRPKEYNTEYLDEMLTDYWNNHTDVTWITFFNRAILITDHLTEDINWSHLI